MKITSEPQMRRSRRFAKLTCQVVLIAATTLTSPVVVVAQDISRAFLCDRITGYFVGAPNWRPEPDGYASTSILIVYKGGNTLSRVASFRDGAKIYDAAGLGMSMKGGFSVVVFGGEYVETYVVNVGTLELLHTAIRAGSGTLPNSVKSFRGFCKPAGDLAR